MKPVFRVIAEIALFGALLVGVLILFRAASGWQSQSAQPGQAYPPPTDAKNAPAATPTGEPGLAASGALAFEVVENGEAVLRREHSIP
jgi:hypothetical protein